MDLHFYKRVFDTSPILKVITDSEGVIIEINTQVEKIFGYSNGELTGKSVEVLIPERFRSDHTRYRTLFAENPLLRPMGKGRDLFGLRKNGEEIPVEIGLNPIFFGGSLFILISILDLSERKKIEYEREGLLRVETKAREKAEDTNRMKDEFLAVISHELRTPLQSILGWSGMLRSGVLDAGKQNQALQNVERSARIQARLIEDILDMTGLIMGKLRLVMGRVDLIGVIQNAIDSVHPAIREKDIKIKVDMDPRANLVYGDENRLQQVIWNLLSNSVKFTPRDGTIEIKLLLDDSSARITVSDNGEGISKEFLPYIFERFKQADSSHTRIHGGLGLGLAIVRHLVELHNGTVHVHSDGTGKGSQFTVRLPLLRIGEIAEIKSGSNIQSYMASIKNKTVLFVDDDQSTREIISVMLGLQGINVKLAGSVDEALMIMKEFKIDFIVSDLEMPEKSGFTLIQKVRASEAGTEKKIPAIALTAHAQIDMRMQALRGGFDAYISKPVDLEGIIRVLADIQG